MAVNEIDSETEWAACEEVIRRFESAWHAGRPNLSAFLRADSPHPTQLLVELVHIDLEFRLRAGDDARVEEYLDRFPALADRSQALDLVAAEFTLRNRHRPPAWPEEYWLRFPEHLADLRELLPDQDRPGGLTPTRPAGRVTAPLTVVPTIPGYQIEGELGRGGMGVVYKARDLILHRTVAVKTFASVPGTDARARFAREAEAIARLDHPHTVPVYEVGEWNPGGKLAPVPFFVMKWYPGGSLDAAAAGPGTDPAAQARVVAAVARAVHHAHQRGVLHRDLKPSNILLDEAGQPHVADFGLAGRFDPDDPGTLTGVGVVGTPAYMAPEQARSPKQVTVAADVYGLGALLYHQLTGHAPFTADTPLATLDLVSSAPPERPSAVNPAVPRDLETICLKCLEKDPAHRYAGAAELADDLDRFLAGKPVAARPARPWEHGWRWLRRHPLLTGMTLTTAAALLTAVAVLSASNARIREKERETNAAYLRECALRYQLQEAVAREERMVYLERVSSAGRLYAGNQPAQAWWYLDNCPPAHRGWEWRYLDTVRAAGPVELTGHTTAVRSAAYLPDGRIASLDAVGHFRVWDVAGGIEQRTWKVRPVRAPVLCAHPGCNWVLGTDADGSAVWDADTGAEVRRFTGKEWAGFSPDGSRVAVADGNIVHVWSVPEWEEVGELRGHTGGVTGGAFGPDGTLYTTGLDRTVRTWRPGAKTPSATRRVPDLLSGLAVIAGGALLAESHPEAVVFTDPGTGELLQRFEFRPAGRQAVAAGPAPAHVAVGGVTGEVVVWDASRRRVARTYRGHAGQVTAVAVGPNGRGLASVGFDQVVRVWDPVREPGVRTLFEASLTAGSLAVSADRSRVAVGPRVMGNPLHNAIRVFDPTTGKELRNFPGTGDVAFHPDSRRLASGRLGGGVTVRDVNSGAELWSRPAPNLPDLPATKAGGQRVAFSPDGRLIASWDVRGGGVRLYAADDGAEAGVIDTGDGFVYALAFSDAGRLAVAAKGRLTVWDVVARTRLPWEDVRETSAVAFSPDGKWLATAEEKVVRLRDAATGKVDREFVGTPARVNALAFGPGGSRLVTGSSDRRVQVWDVASGRELLSLPGAGETVSAVAWDGERVYALDDALRVWSAARGE